MEQQPHVPEKKDYTFELAMTGFILLMLIMAVLYFWYQQHPLTGDAYVTVDKGKEELDQLLGRLTLTKYLGQMSFCVQIVMSPTITHSYEVEKTALQMTTRPVSNCNEFSDDLIIRFPSYAKFEDLKQYPTCYKMVNNGRGQNYWFLPSKLWPVGDTPNCNAEFQEKICPAIYYCINPNNVPGNVLGCCAKDKLTATQQKRANTAASDGIKKGVREQGVKRG